MEEIDGNKTSAEHTGNTTKKAWNWSRWIDTKTRSKLGKNRIKSPYSSKFIVAPTKP